MAKFVTSLVCMNLDDVYWLLYSPLIYESEIVGRIEVPKGFITDLASVPKVPLVYEVWGNKAHHEAVIHDYLYRTDSVPQVTFDQANEVFLEAMGVRGKPWYIKYPMYWGVCLGGSQYFHTKRVSDENNG